LLAVVSSSLLVTSCATLAVSKKGHEEHKLYWSITKVLSARLSNDELWLMLELKRERSNFTKPAALMFPTEDTTWLRDQDGTLRCPSAVPWTKASEISPQATELRNPKDFPSTGREIEIQNLELDNPQDLSEIKTSGDPWTVLFVKFKPTALGSRNKSEEMPVLALVREADLGHESEKCILYSFFVGSTRHEGWVLVAPFAMAFDAVTLPFQLLGVLWWFIIGD
jgi:hypothetical protein